MLRRKNSKHAAVVDPNRNFKIMFYSAAVLTAFNAAAGISAFCFGVTNAAFSFAVATLGFASVAAVIFFGEGEDAPYAYTKSRLRLNMGKHSNS